MHVVPTCTVPWLLSLASTLTVKVKLTLHSRSSADTCIHAHDGLRDWWGPKTHAGIRVPGRVRSTYVVKHPLATKKMDGVVVILGAYNSYTSGGFMGADLRGQPLKHGTVYALVPVVCCCLWP